MSASEEDESAEFGKKVLAAAPVLIVHLDRSGAIRYVNPHFERLTGHRAEAVRGADWFATLLPARDGAQIRALFHRFLAEARTQSVVNPIVTRAGDELEIEWTNELLRDAEDRPSGVLSFGRDVTERVRAERTVRAIAQRQRGILDGAFALAGIFDLDGNMLDATQTRLDMAGLRREDVIGRPFTELAWLADAEQRKFMAMHARARRGEVVREEFRALVAPDTFADFEVVAGPLRDETGAIEAVFASAVDITERKTAERAAHRAAGLLRAVVDGAPAILFALDRDGVFTLSEGRGLRMLGKRPGASVGTSALDLYRDVPGAADTFRRALAGEQILQVARVGACEFEVVLGPSFAPDGQIDGVIGVAFDITARSAALDARRDSEERLRLALAASGQCMWELDLRGPSPRYSADTARLLDYDPGDLADRAPEPLAALVHPDDRERSAGAFHAYLVGASPGYAAEYRVRTRSGAWKWIFSTGQIVERDPSGRPLRVLGTHQDIDARKHAELQTAAALREKETLLREVHHRVKNNLQIIFSLLHFQAKKASAPAVAAACADIRRRLLAMNLVHDKLYRSSSLASVDFGDYVRSLVGALASSFESRGALRLDLPAAPLELPSEVALPAGMILCELVANVYKYAWPGAPGSARVGLSLEAGEIALVVEDDGVGLPAGLDPHSADSFGWQLVRTLVAQLGGRFELVSGGGTRARVTFPPPAPPVSPSE